MARVNLDSLSGLLAADPPPLPGGLDPASSDSFDRHLQRARDTVEQHAEDRETLGPPSPSSAAPSPAGEGRDAPVAQEGERTAGRAKEEGRGGTEEEETENGIAGAAPAADPGAAASANEAAGADAPEEAPALHQGKSDLAADPVRGKAKPGRPQPSAGNAPNPTDASEGELLPQSETLVGQEVAEQASGPVAEQAPPRTGTELKPAKSPAKTQMGSAAGVVQPTAEADAAGEAAAQSGQAAAETPGQTGAMSTLGASPGHLPAVREAQAPATTSRRSGSRSASRAAGEGRNIVEGSPPGPEAEPSAATPQQPGELRPPAPPATVSAAGKQEPDRGKTPDVKAESGTVQIDSQNSKETPPGQAAASSADAQAAPGAEQADRVRFVQRVARAFEAAAARGGPMRLRLHPPELGSLRLEISIRRGAVTARIEAETETAQRMLLDNLSGLRQRLAEHHLRVERFDVQWTGRSPGDALQQPGGHSQGQARGGSPAPRASAAPDRPPAVPAASPPHARPVHPASFDVII